MQHHRTSKPEEDISHIRQMMERSTSFLSLSGLSGISAGLIGMAGFLAVYYIITTNGLGYSDLKENPYRVPLTLRILAVACLTLAAALGSAFYFTQRKARKTGQSLWSKPARNALTAFALPVSSGGLLCLILIWHRLLFLVAPLTLVFYGLALTGMSRHTHREVYWLGICEIALGIFACMIPGYGLIFWMLGFGVLHIVYGAALYKKYK